MDEEIIIENNKTEYMPKDFKDKNNYNNKAYYDDEDKTIISENDNTTLNSIINIKKEKNVSNDFIISTELKEKIEKMVDIQFEKEYKKIKDEYDEKIEELLNEQEKVYNKTEILKSKILSLERYLKYYCRKENIDYQSLLEE